MISSKLAAKIAKNVGFRCCNLSGSEYIIVSKDTMKKLTSLCCFFIIVFTAGAQDRDTTSLGVEKLVDSAFKELPSYKFQDLPLDYFVIKVKFLNGTVKRAPFYAAEGMFLYLYSADSEKLDTLHAGTVRHISFRMKNRTAELAGGGALIGGFIGAIVGAALYDCSNCDGDDFHIEQVWWGAEGALIGGAIAGTGGLIAAIFNDGNFSIKGDTEKFSKMLPSINKFSVLRKRKSK
jgi:hypothetical protein